MKRLAVAAGPFKHYTIFVVCSILFSSHAYVNSFMSWHHTTASRLDKCKKRNKLQLLLEDLPRFTIYIKNFFPYLFMLYSLYSSSNWDTIELCVCKNNKLSPKLQTLHCNFMY